MLINILLVWMDRMRTISVVGTCFFLATSCAKVPQADDAKVSAIVQERMHRRVHWNQDTSQDVQIKCCIDLLLRQELTEDAAVQIALLNNPLIQASFEDLGIAQADLVEAGLLQNPVFEGFVRFPSQGSFSTNAEFSVMQGFLNVFLIPLRKKVAATELEKSQLRVANIVLDLAFDVQETYFRLQAEEKKFDFLKQLVEGEHASFLLAKAQCEAGSINVLELQDYETSYLKAKLEMSDSETAIVGLRKTMNTQLGLRASESSWHLRKELPEMPANEIVTEAVEQQALERRLDLAQARLEVKRIAEFGATKEWWAYTDPEIGISGERDSDGAHVLGPAVSFALPFFNHGQADRARAFAMLKQSQHRLHALEIDVLAEVRAGAKQLNIHRNRVELFRKEYLPLQESILASSQRYYNVMGLSVYTLLQKKRAELRAQIDYTSSLSDYWLSRVALDRTVGGVL